MANHPHSEPLPQLVKPPQTFAEYVRSFGPGLVVVLTWLGAGDVVDMGVAGGNYGYALMWVLVVAVVVRFLFVSLIAKYQLCNQHGESVLDGLARVHPWYAPLLLFAAIGMGHLLGSYMTVGIGESCRNLSGIGEVWHWALIWNLVALGLVFRPAYARIERLFKILLGVLAISFLGTAVMVGPSVGNIAHGLYRVGLPEQSGDFEPLLVAMAMIGAVGGSIANLFYPYFIEGKGWRGPEFRRVQQYDFMLAIGVMIVLNLSIWTLGAELLHARRITIHEMDDLPRLLSEVLGPAGRTVFYLGIFSAVFTSLVGQSLGLALLASHAWLRWQAGCSVKVEGYRNHPLYRWVVVWCVLSPLIWTIPGMPGFIKLTLVGNSLQVVLVPLIAGGLWYITATERCIGREYKNRWWENLLMVVIVAFLLYGACLAIQSVFPSL